MKGQTGTWARMTTLPSPLEHSQPPLLTLGRRAQLLVRLGARYRLCLRMPTACACQRYMLYWYSATDPALYICRYIYYSKLAELVVALKGLWHVESLSIHNLIERMSEGTRRAMWETYTVESGF